MSLSGIPLFQRVGYQGENFLILVQEQHGPKIAESFVRKARRGQEFEAFYLTKVCPFAQGEEVKEFRDIVPPALN